VIFGIMTVEERREGKREGRKEGTKNGRKYTGVKERKGRRQLKGRDGKERNEGEQSRKDGFPPSFIPTAGGPPPDRPGEKATKGKRWEGQKSGRAKQDRTERAKRRTLETETPPIHMHRTHTPVG
jgi:hypothetical protein